MQKKDFFCGDLVQIDNATWQTSLYQTFTLVTENFILYVTKMKDSDMT